jgi:sugar-specific transcriptional regulator TrmB
MATLRDLGLSEYEARAYRALLNTGPTTAKELSPASDVPMGRVYDVLNSLEQYNLVRSQASSRPKKYVAVEPETALNRVLDDKRRELEAKVDQYERIVEELSGELDAADPVEEQFWTAAVGQDETIDLLVERLAAADDRIVMVATDEVPAVDISASGVTVTDELAAALNRGVDVELLMTPGLVDRLPKGVGERYRETLSGHPGFSVRTNKSVSGTFNLVDDVEVCIQVPNPVASGAPFAMIDLKDPGFAARVYEEYRPRWEDARPLSF